MVELTPFKWVIGVDPSANLQSSAESLPFLEDESVDLVVSGEYRHV